MVSVQYLLYYLFQGIFKKICNLCINSFLSKISKYIFVFNFTDLENVNEPRRKQAYNLRTRKPQPQVFDSDSEDDFQTSWPSTSGICNKSLQREGRFFTMYRTL